MLTKYSELVSLMRSLNKTNEEQNASRKDFTSAVKTLERFRISVRALVRVDSVISLKILMIIRSRTTRRKCMSQAGKLSSGDHRRFESRDFLCAFVFVSSYSSQFIGRSTS